MSDIKKNGRWGWLALFVSAGTLLCCALPILLVSLGLGAVVAATVSAVPFLVTLSLYKNWLFAGSFLLIAATFWLHRTNGRSCPSDPMLAERCRKARAWNGRLLTIAATVWSVGFFAAYLLEPLSSLLG